MNQIPRIFIAYARQDAHLLEKLRKPLNVLRRNQHCDIFYDGEIVPGERWDERLKAELHRADIFVLLVTDDFLDSDYINDVELPEALEEERQGRAKVVPIILCHCMWQFTLLSKFQVVLHEGRPIEPSDGYVHAAQEIARVIRQRNETLRRALEKQQRLETDRQRREADARKNEEQERLKKEAEAALRQKQVEEEKQRQAEEARLNKEADDRRKNEEQERLKREAQAALRQKQVEEEKQRQAEEARLNKEADDRRKKEEEKAATYIDFEALFDEDGEENLREQLNPMPESKDKIATHQSHVIAYCLDNQDVAEKITSRIKEKGYFLRPIVCAVKGSLRQAFSKNGGKMLLIITDNFLKSEACLAGALDVVQWLAGEGRLMAVVADGWVQLHDGSRKVMPTSFDRVSNIIHYMNHWQDHYLYLRRERGRQDNAALEEQIETARLISGEIGEFLRFLRTQHLFSLEEFEANGYTAFSIQ